MKPADLQTLAQSIRSRLVAAPVGPALNETPGAFARRLSDDARAHSLARYVAAAHGGGARFLHACGLRPDAPLRYWETAAPE